MESEDRRAIRRHEETVGGGGMKEYIERGLLLIGVDGCISALHAKAKGDPILGSAIKLVELTRNYIASVPAAEAAEVRHGRWVNTNKEVERMCKCSECGYPISYFWSRTPYCPNCGARMDKEYEL